MTDDSQFADWETVNRRNTRQDARVGYLEEQVQRQKRRIEELEQNYRLMVVQITRLERAA